jgi:Zn-dependent peptidase ImmA (M78 family)/transcriptional regulator with XRE-family HTH domain
MAVTREVIAERVKSLLSAHSMEHQQLAAVLGIDPSGLSRALSGRREFKSLEIALIADAFGVPVGTLLEEHPKERQDIRLAARRQPGQSPAVEEALARVQTLTSVSELIRPEHPIRKEFSWLTDGSRSPWAQGQELAAQARAQLSIRDGLLPADLTEFAALLEAELDIDVALEPLSQGLDGLSANSGDLRLALVNTSTAAPRRRWTLAHELGHLVAGDSQQILLDENLYGSKSPDETRANAFAAAFLMPRSTLWERWEGRIVDEDLITELLDVFGVSLDALAFRLHNLSMVNAEGRDHIRDMWPAMSAQRTQAAQERQGRRFPARLLTRAIQAFVVGELGVRPLSALLEIEPDEFLRMIEPDDQEAAAMSDESVSARS